MKKENILGLIVFIIFLVLFGFYQTSQEQKRYKDDGIISTGVVTRVIHDYKMRPDVQYEFFIGVRRYHGESSYPEFKSGIGEELVNRSFPVIYLKSNPSKSEILISRAKYSHFKIAFPDSLSWTSKLEVP